MGWSTRGSRVQRAVGWCEIAAAFVEVIPEPLFRNSFFPRYAVCAHAGSVCALCVRKAGCSRYRARRSHAATHFLRSGSCAVGGERACPYIGEFQVVPRVLRPDRERSGRFFVSRIGSKQTESAKFSTLLYRILQNGKYNPAKISHNLQPLRTLSPRHPTE